MVRGVHDDKAPRHETDFAEGRKVGCVVAQWVGRGGEEVNSSRWSFHGGLGWVGWRLQRPAPDDDRVA